MEPEERRINRHDAVVKLVLSHSPRIGGLIIDAYGLKCLSPSITLMENVRLDLQAEEGINKRYPDIAGYIDTGIMRVSIIIEVKRLLKDLWWSGEQYLSYMGNSRLFFIAVPERLVGECICRVRRPQCVLGKIGVINADNGDIVVMPSVQDCGFGKETRMLSNMLADGRYRPEGLPVRLPMDVVPFLDMDGLRIRTPYLYLARAMGRSGYEIGSGVTRNKPPPG